MALEREYRGKAMARARPAPVPASRRPGGLLAVDSVLRKGRVADPAYDDATTQAVRAFNDYVHGDDRVDVSLIPIGDGLSLIRRLT